MTLDAVHAAHITLLRSMPASVDFEGLRLGSHYVMFFAEAELMRLHAELLVEGKESPDVLEVGLGLGVFAEQIARLRVGSYCAIEPHHQVAQMTRQRVLRSYPAPTRVITEPWQTVALPAESVDAIMYDTWPPDGHADSDFTLFVEHVAMRCLRPGGRFSFFQSGSGMSDHRRQVLQRNFSTVTVRRYELPPAVIPASWTKPTTDFLIPVGTKGEPCR